MREVQHLRGQTCTKSSLKKMEVSPFPVTAHSTVVITFNIALLDSSLCHSVLNSPSYRAVCAIYDSYEFDYRVSLIIEISIRLALAVLTT
jgi:hypothetical protein